MRVTIAVSAGVIMFLAACGVSFAHHGSSASYDSSREITLTGLVTQFNWHNPHAQLYFDVKDENGKVVSWGAELNSPGVLAREGWTRTEFRAGDIVTITLNPSRAGTPYGNTVRSKPILVNGKEKVPARPGRTTVD